MNQDKRLLDEIEIQQEELDAGNWESEFGYFAQVISSIRPHAVFTLDPKGCILTWNKKAELITGYKAQEIIGESYTVFLNENVQDSERIKANLLSALENSLFEDEGRCRRKNGSIFWASKTLTPQWNEKNELQGFILILRDVTQQNQAKKSLSRQFSLEKLLQEIAVAANETPHPDAAFQFALERICEFTGWNLGHVWILDPQTPDAVVSSKIWSLSDPVRFADFRAASEQLRIFKGSGLVGRVFEGAGPVWIDNVTQAPDYIRTKPASLVGIKMGAAFPVMVRKEVGAVLEFYSEEETEVNPFLMNVMTNIGTQLGRVIERADAEAALSQSEARFHSIFENAAIGIALVDPNGNLLESNQKLLDMLGYSFDELSQKLLSIEGEQDGQTISRQAWEELLNGEKVSLNLERSYLQKERHTVVCRHTVAPIYAGKAEPEFVLVLVEDISENRQMAAELKELQIRIMEGREMERLQLAQDLHEGILQDLYGVSYQVQAFSLSVPEAAKIHDGLQVIQSSLYDTISKLRNFCRELRPPTLFPFGLEKAIRSHIETFQEQHPHIQVDLSLVHNGLPLPKSIRLSLFRIYQEAMSNIAKHSQADRVYIEFQVDAEQATLEITDNGKGFEVPDRWIEFARKGHLGLANSVQRAEAVGGTIDLKSIKGEGVKLNVQVPLPIHS